jgi:aromatic ring-opening dioxygenase catalytic subunit (LigB family)
MHPSLEHFLPIYIAIGNSNNKIADAINNEILNKTLSMQSYIFKD